MNAEFRTPRWVHDAVFYQIFPDRFAASGSVEKPGALEPWDAPPTPHGFKGGDLAGIAEKLGYLADLGITALYLTPIFQSASNHRYHTHDYYQVDPLLGGRPAFDRLLREAHAAGIRVVLDGVFNHASRGFFPFNHVLETGRQSPYRDWFHVKGYPLHAYEGTPNYACWWNLPALPTFNHSNPVVRAYLLDVARYWIEQGVDGWRLDVASEIREPGFWQEFRRVVKRANPDAYITGEIAGDASPWLAGDQFDGVMNYLAAYPCWSFFGGDRFDRGLVKQWETHGKEFFVKDARGFADVVTGLLSRYPRPAVAAQLNLLDSHDTARFVTVAGGTDALRLAVLFQMTYPGAPCVYYGDEIGMPGRNDPDCRRAFPWDGSRWDNQLLSWYRSCIRLRREHPALRTGTWEILDADRGVVSYTRTLADDRVIVLLNSSPEPRAVDIRAPAGLREGARFRDALGSGTVEARAGRLRGTTVPSRTGMALLPE